MSLWANQFTYSTISVGHYIWCIYFITNKYTHFLFNDWSKHFSLITLFCLLCIWCFVLFNAFCFQWVKICFEKGKDRHIQFVPLKYQHNTNTGFKNHIWPLTWFPCGSCIKSVTLFCLDNTLYLPIYATGGSSWFHNIADYLSLFSKHSSIGN